MHRLTVLARPLALCLGLASLAGCYNLHPETHARLPAAFSPTPPAERELGELRWGLALSGGGIRAALFSMGAMKGLYEARLMDSVQVVSTVSGGGYMAYWLYTREYQRPSAGRFARNTFESDEFRVGMCDVELTSNFYSYGEMLKTLTGSETLVEGYNYALLRTFGHAVHDTVELERSGELKDLEPHLQIHHLAPRMRERTLPYFVVNATVVDPRPRQGWRDGLYEMTPLFRGNEAYGYAPWDSASMPLRQAIAISGAAYRRGLKQPIPNPHPYPRQPTLTLADGGGSENLGAIALVRRRVKNIIVVDAEFDPHYGFGAYENLRTRLRSWGYALSVPSIERRSRRERLQSGAHVGVVRSMVRGDTFSANIYYIKMSLPVSLDSILADSVADERGGEIDERVTDALAASATSPGADWKCEVLRNYDYSLRDRFIHTVRHYSRFRPERRRRKSPLNFRVTDFPQYTTGDQSFHRDQTTAFVGLGALLADEMVAKIPGFSRPRWE